VNWKNLTKDAKLQAFKSLVKELELDQDETPKFELNMINDYIPRALERLNNPGLLDGVPSGYTDLDEIIGGFADEELIVVGGATGQGKTQFVQCIMMNQVLNNIPILFFTLEMSQIETTIRFMRMIKSKCDSEVLKELPICFYAGDVVNLKILDEAIKQAKEKGVKLVAIDHLHFFSRTTENSAQEIGYITREIKMMARRYKIPIILISHVRKLYNATASPELDDLKDSSAIAQDADTVIMIRRKMDSNVMRAKVLKNRRTGKIGNTQYELDKNYYLQEVDYEPEQY